MKSLTHTNVLLKLFKNKSVIRPLDLEKAGIPRMTLTRLTTKGLIEKIGWGLYRLKDANYSEHESLITVAAKAPQAVFCLLTALQFHGLTTQLPRKVWIAMLQKSHVPKIDDPPIKMILYSGNAFTSGIESYKKHQVTIRVYSVEKTIADCFKHRNKIGIDVAIEALKDAKEKKKISAEKLWRFAKICRVTNVMHPYLESLD